MTTNAPGGTHVASAPLRGYDDIHTAAHGRGGTEKMPETMVEA